jgi:hypothetical protein
VASEHPPEDLDSALLGLRVGRNPGKPGDYVPEFALYLERASNKSASFILL